MTAALRSVATGSLLVAAACALAVLTDLFVLGRRQRMRIMEAVWPITALWAGPLGLAAYLAWGRARSRAERQPFPVLVAKGATHCGGGCTVGDVAAEAVTAFAPLAILGSDLAGTWTLDFVLAFGFGVAFQYLTIRPMHGVPPREALARAVKADAASLVAWQVGMYGWMALTRFVLFARPPTAGSPVYWFMMQVAMLCGFLTSYPVNWLLLRRGVKEAM